MTEKHLELLENQIFISIFVSELEILFCKENGDIVKMFHEQDCCEKVVVEDVCGNIEDITNQLIVSAVEVSTSNNPDGINWGYDDSMTWTFYHIRTNEGTVTIRWYGYSNGCYSEKVDVVLIEGNK